ncbi:ribonuclease HII [Alcalisalibacterium limoincola]|uniref:Ribonuclease HII n=1 Tax=Alkalisalibacterium limincola TaxID=2699169 RepID=A0A5C8KPQ7_9GAMM|nr:ribonuclease HII [Alkalisalibacterium limincola]
MNPCLADPARAGGHAAGDVGLLVAGVDEAGRGPLAGPVAVAAVILDPKRPIEGLDDSKKLSAARRDALFDLIQAQALAWHVTLVTAEEIDRINILQATFQGMRRCVAALQPVPALVRVDGHQVPPGLGLAAEALVGGDGLDAAIGAASILAKVTRDRWMQALDERHPGYGFARHKGYPTPEHLDALLRLGPCPEHRRSFAPLRIQGSLFD